MDKEQFEAHTGRAIGYQRKEWGAQRIGWILMVALVVAAAAGLLGASGPVATAQVDAPDGSMQVEYLRLDHHLGSGELTVEIAPGFVTDGEVRLWLDRTYVDDLGLERVVPEPDRVELEPERVVYVFNVGAEDGPLTVSFSYRQEGLWRAEAELGLVNGSPVEFSQFVFP